MSQNSSRRQQTLPGWLTSLPSALFSIRHVRPLFFPDRTEGRESRSPCLQWLNTNTHAYKGFVIKRCRSGSRFSPFPPTHTHTRAYLVGYSCWENRRHLPSWFLSRNAWNKGPEPIIHTPVGWFDWFWLWFCVSEQMRAIMYACLGNKR